MCFPADQQVPFAHVPAAGPGHHDGERGVSAQRVLLAFGRGVLQCSLGGVAEVEDRFDHIGPGGRAGVLEVGEPHLGAGVQRVDGHLGRGGRPGHLDPAVLQGCRCRSNAPVGVADFPGLRQEVQAAGPGNVLALDGSGLEKFGTGSGKAEVKFLDEGESLRGQDFPGPVDGLGIGDGESHFWSFPRLRIRRGPGRRGWRRARSSRAPPRRRRRRRRRQRAGRRRWG
ncbi:hypothetical protein ACVWZ7_002643 [Arthrobacter sp. TE12232]